MRFRRDNDHRYWRPAALARVAREMAKELDEESAEHVGADRADNGSENGKVSD